MQTYSLHARAATHVHLIWAVYSKESLTEQPAFQQNLVSYIASSRQASIRARSQNLHSYVVYAHFSEYSSIINIPFDVAADKPSVGDLSLVAGPFCVGSRFLRRKFHHCPGSLSRF